jgi:hypothetical protein
MFSLLIAAQGLFLAGLFIVVSGARFLRRPAPPSPYLAVFVYSSLGILLAVTGVALVATRGRTAFLPGLVPIALVLWKLTAYGQSASWSLPSGFFKATALHVLALAGLCALHYWLRADPEGVLPIKIPFPDISFYGRLTDSLIETGQESYVDYHARLSPGFSGPTPYHYFELWLAGILARLSDTPGTVALTIPGVALLGLLVLSGLWALLESSGLSTWLGRAGAVLALFLPPGILFLDFSQTLLWEGIHYSFLLHWLFTSTKVLQIVWVFCGASIALTRGFRDLAACVLLLGVPFSSVVAPAVLIASTLLLLAEGRGRISPGLADKWLWLWAPVLVAVSTVAFFGFWGSNTEIASTGPRWTAVGLLTRINIVATTLLRLPVVLPVCLLFALTCWRSQGAARRMMVSVATMGLTLSLGGALALGILTPFGRPDQFQLSTMPIAAAVTLSGLVTLAVWIGDPAYRPWFRSLVFGVVTLVALGRVGLARAEEQTPDIVPYYRRYSGDYLSAIARLSLGSPRGGFLVTPEETGFFELDKPVYKFLPGIYTLGGYIGLIPGLWTPVQLSLSGDGLAQEPLRGATVFARYRDELIRTEPGVSDAECQRRFILSRRLSFLVLSPNSKLPQELESLVDHELKDRSTGERFVVLRLP